MAKKSTKRTPKVATKKTATKTKRKYKPKLQEYNIKNSVLDIPEDWAIGSMIGGVMISFFSIVFLLIGLADKTIPLKEILCNGWFIGFLGLTLVSIEAFSRMYVGMIDTKKFNSVSMGGALELKFMSILPSVVVSGIITGLTFGVATNLNAILKCLLNVAIALAWIIGVLACLVVAGAIVFGIGYGFVWLNTKWFNSVVKKKANKNDK